MEERPNLLPSPQGTSNVIDETVYKRVAIWKQYTARTGVMSLNAALGNTKLPYYSLFHSAG